MRGSEFLDKLEAAFPGVLKRLYAGQDYSDKADRTMVLSLAFLAAAVGAHVTPEVLAKARHRHGLVAFRSKRRLNGDAATWRVRFATSQANLIAAPTHDTGTVSIPRESGPDAEIEAAEEQLPLAATPAPQLSPDAQAIVGALGQMKGALLSRLTELERRLGVREERV